MDVLVTPIFHADPAASLVFVRIFVLVKGNEEIRSPCAIIGGAPDAMTMKTAAMKTTTMEPAAVETSSSMEAAAKAASMESATAMKTAATVTASAMSTAATTTTSVSR